jgi:two-component system, LytTR family, sensor kinase
MAKQSEQNWVFTISVFVYYVLHEVVYGLLGYEFFLASSLLELVSCFCLFGIVGLTHIPFRGYLEKRVDWSENPLKRFVLQSLLFAGASGLFVVLLRILWVWVRLQFQAELFLSFQSLMIDFLLLVVVVELTVLLEFSQYLLQKWNSSRIEMATFQKEKAQFNLELLRTQINPHFLFNNLNTLGSLIYIDQDKASAFLRKLSGVYRSILEYRDKEVITLEEELLFFNQYKDLLEIRFEKMLFFSVSIPDKLNAKKMIPLTLQMLVENAIKHNVLSLNRPLTISIECVDGYLLVENNFQPKESLEYSSGLGLKMIENRFAYLTKLPVLIDKTSAHFLVKLPLID